MLTRSCVKLRPMICRKVSIDKMILWGLFEHPSALPFIGFIYTRGHLCIMYEHTDKGGRIFHISPKYLCDGCLQINPFTSSAFRNPRIILCGKRAGHMQLNGKTLRRSIIFRRFSILYVFRIFFPTTPRRLRDLSATLRL